MKKQLPMILKSVGSAGMLNILLSILLAFVWLGLHFHAEIFDLPVLLIAMSVCVLFSPLYFRLKKDIERPLIYTLLTVISYAVFNACVYLLLIKPQKTVEITYIVSMGLFNISFVGMIIADIIYTIYQKLKKAVCDRRAENISQKAETISSGKHFIRAAAVGIVPVLLMHFTTFACLYNYEQCSYILALTPLIASFFASLYYIKKAGTDKPWITFSFMCAAQAIYTPLLCVMLKFVIEDDNSLFLFYILPHIICMIVTDLICTVCVAHKKAKHTQTEL